MENLEEKEAVTSKGQSKRAAWSNHEKIEVIRFRLQELSFEEIGGRIDRTKHAVRSEYGRIRRGESDVTISLKDLPELRELLPLQKREKKSS